MLQSLRLLMEILPRLRPRHARVLGSQPPPVVVYSDASWPDPREPMTADTLPPRVGWVIFSPGSKPHGFTMQLGKEFVDFLIPRKTQVFAAEAIVALIAPILTPDLLADKQILWLGDNEAAISSLIRGGL
jgi:hypothetical protein